MRRDCNKANPVMCEALEDRKLHSVASNIAGAAAFVWNKTAPVRAITAPLRVVTIPAKVVKVLYTGEVSIIPFTPLKITIPFLKPKMVE